MRCPPHEQNHEACLPQKPPLLQPTPSDHHEGKQAIHDNHTGQAQNEKSHHVDESLDHRDFLIAASVAMLRSL
jgi:hypothetical protein